MRAASCVTVSRPAPAPIQHSFAESVQRRQMVEDYRRALCAPFHAAAYGTRKNFPRESMLVRNIERGSNQVAETTVAVSMFALAHEGLEAARRPFQIMDAMLCSHAPAGHNYSLDELQQIETDLESQLNPLQVQYIMGDRSTRVKLQLLEKFTKYRAVLDQIIEKLQRDLYGAKR